MTSAEKLPASNCSFAEALACLIHPSVTKHARLQFKGLISATKTAGMFTGATLFLRFEVCVLNI
jgi:hypothetical protein